MPWLVVAAIHVFLAISIPTVAQDSRGIFVSGERQALVIGNNAYQTAPLQNPANDAEDMSRVLSELGFRVTLRKNADRRSMEDSIRGFGRQLMNGGVGLFYFAGHGMQVEGRNYLIPVNARIESESDVKYEAVDAGFVLGKMEDAKNQLNIVILDACRNNPFSINFRAADRGLARMDAPTGSLIVYATAPGEVAADGPDRNGVFTRHLIKHMQTPNLPVEQVLKRVRIDVAAETKQRQIPWESSSLMGDFFFKSETTEKSVLSKVHEKPLVSEQASIQPSGAIQPNDHKTYKLAIFPFSNDYRQGAWLYQLENLDELTIKILQKALIDNKIFYPKYSYYDLEARFQAEKISDKIITKEIKENLWQKNYAIVNKKPNLDLLCELGNKIKVNAIITYWIYYDTTMVSVSAFLIDVDKKRMTEAVDKDNSFKGTNVGSAFRSEIENQIRKVTSNVLKEFN